MKVRELCVLQLRVEIADVGKEFRVTPVSAHRRFLRIAHGAGKILLCRYFPFMLGIHQFAVGLVIPPHVA